MVVVNHQEMIEFHTYDPPPSLADVSIQPHAAAANPVPLLSGPPTAKAKAKSKARAKAKPKPQPKARSAYVLGRTVRKTIAQPKPKALRTELQPSGDRIKLFGFASDCSVQRIELPIAKHRDQFWVEFRETNRAYQTMVSSHKFQPTVGYWRLLI